MKLGTMMDILSGDLAGLKNCQTGLAAELLLVSVYDSDLPMMCDLLNRDHPAGCGTDVH